MRSKPENGPAADGFVQSLFHAGDRPEGCGAGPEGADAGQHDAVGAEHRIRISGHHDPRRLFQRARRPLEGFRRRVRTEAQKGRR